MIIGGTIMDYLDAVEPKDLLEQLYHVYNTKIDQLNKWKEKEGTTKYISEKYNECISLTNESILLLEKLTNIVLESFGKIANEREVRNRKFMERNRLINKINKLDNFPKKLYVDFNSAFEELQELEETLTQQEEKVKRDIIQLYKLTTYLLIRIIKAKNKMNKLPVLKDISTSMYSNIEPITGNIFSVIVILHDKIIAYENAQADAANNHLSFIEKYIEIITLGCDVSLQNTHAVEKLFDHLNAQYEKTT